MSAFAQQQSIAFRANVVAKSVSSKKQSKKIQRCSLRVEAAKKSVGDLSKSDLEGTLNNAHAVASSFFHLSSCIFARRNAMGVWFCVFSFPFPFASRVYSFI
jgi:hypothetical protein